MKVKSKIYPFLLLVLVCVVNLTAIAKSNGTIKGRIVDANGDGLPFANVVIDGTNVGIATDIEGDFILRNVPSGEQKLTVSYVGYANRTEEVTVVAGKTIEIEIVLNYDELTTEDVVITAQAKGQREAINQQINSTSIVNVVAPDRIQQNPDANTAEALGRLPGLSLVRSGGEGTSIMIRGMGAAYSTVSLNGIELPSTDATTRGTSVSGISQFLLQSVVVHKTITPDMDGNSVAGSIDLKLSAASDTMHYSLFAQGGYNHMNDYYGNYKFGGNFSDRFFNDKLGLRFDANIERVNRSTQTMSGSYVVESNTTGGLGHEEVLINNAGLNEIHNIKNKQAATLVLDYALSSFTNIYFYNFFSRSAHDYLNATKTFFLSDNTISNNIYQDNNAENLLFQSSLKVEQALSWIELEYGVAFSQTHNYSPGRRTWDFYLSPGYEDEYVTKEARLLPPAQLVNLSNDNGSEEALSNTDLIFMGTASDDMLQKNITANFNAKFPLKIGNSVSGYIKTGVKYKYTDRVREYLYGNQNLRSSPIVARKISTGIDWLHLNRDYITASSVYGNNITDFLEGEYNYGWYPNIGRLNNIWDYWNDYSNRLMGLGKDSVIAAVASYNRIGFSADEYNSSVYNQDLTEEYFGTYLMSEISYKKLMTFVFGGRYEKVTNDLTGNHVTAREYTQIYGFEIPKTKVTTEHKDDFFLPMASIKVKPNKWIHASFSYTNALRRPDYIDLIPNTYINQGTSTLSTKQYRTGNPDLKPELWTNYDLQVVVFGNKVGLFSVNGFYKKVDDKLWARTYYRIKGDEVIPGFDDDDLVQVIETVNHEDPGFVRGVEFEWQTSFWYLPKPFNYFSLTLNYTVLESEIDYPFARIFTTYDTGENGRPTPTMHRVDSTITSRILNQPNNIANVSLGFNYEGFNAWLSFQYTGDIMTSWNYQRDVIASKDKFYRWDLQISQELPVKWLVVLFNIANINDFQESSRIRGDNRPAYLESYGWTSDIGIRYEL